jgi:hypothetical protein
MDTFKKIIGFWDESDVRNMKDVFDDASTIPGYWLLGCFKCDRQTC